MIVTVEDGRAVKVHGDPEHPTTHGALCTKVSRYPERTYHEGRVLHPLRRVGPKGGGRFERVGWDEALADIAGRLKAIAGPDGANAEAIVPYSYAGTMGLLQGESMAARFFNRLGASLLDRTICSSAGGEALIATYGAQDRHARRALRREPADPHLGQQLDHLEPALLDLRAAGQAGRREADLHRPAADRDGGEVPPAHRPPARHRRCPGARGDARADRQRLARPRLHRAPRRRGLARVARARPGLAAGTRGRDLRDRGRRGPRPGARLRHDEAGGDPPQLRHAAGARRRQRGAADRDPAGAGRRLAAPGRRPAALELGLVSRRDRRQRPASARPARQPSAAHDQHDDDRRRPAARDRRDARRRLALRAEDRGARRLQQQPGRGGAAVGEGGGRLRSRRPVHGRARAVHDRHRRPRRLRAAGDHPARAPRPADQLRPHLRARERAGDRAARRGEAEHRDLPPAGGADGLRRSLLRRERRGPGAHRLQAGGARAASTSPACATAAGRSCRSPRRRSPKAASPRRAASAGSTHPASACPTTSRTTNRRSARPSSRPAFRWR